MITRALVACLLAVMLIQPAAAGTGPPDVEQRTSRPYLLEAIASAIYDEATVFWVRTDPRFSNSAIRSSWATLAANRATGTFSQCSQMVAVGPDARCVRACDAAKESCGRQCSSARATCLDQCLGIGFACDFQCHAAYYLCRPNCGGTRDACVFDCPTRGGGRES